MKIILVSSEDIYIDASDLVNVSEFLKKMVEDSIEDPVEGENKEEDIIIHLQYTEKIINSFMDICLYVDRGNLNLNINEIFEILKLANFLEINFLINGLCKTIANFVNNNSIEKLRYLFNNNRDSTHDEFIEFPKSHYTL